MINFLKRDFIFSRLAFILCYILMVFMSFLIGLSGELVGFVFKMTYGSCLLIIGVFSGAFLERKQKNVSDLLVAIGYSGKYQVLERYVLAFFTCIIAMITEIIIEICLMLFCDMKISFDFLGFINSIVLLVLFINLFIFVLYSNQIVKNIFFYIIIFGNLLLQIFGVNLDFLTVSKYVGIYLIIPIIIITIGTFKLCVFLHTKENKEM